MVFELRLQYCRSTNHIQKTVLRSELYMYSTMQKAADCVGLRHCFSPAELPDGLQTGESKLPEAAELYRKCWKVDTSEDLDEHETGLTLEPFKRDKTETNKYTHLHSQTI